MIGAGAIASIATVCGLICFFGTKEVVEQAPLETAGVKIVPVESRKEVEKSDEDGMVPETGQRISAVRQMFQALKLVLSFKPYLQIMLAYLFHSLTIQVRNHFVSLTCLSRSHKS